ncbi:MAG: hypothetical protein ACJ8CB_10105, partial [Ktedonobacteraceae bacterium]
NNFSHKKTSVSFHPCAQQQFCWRHDPRTSATMLCIAFSIPERDGKNFFSLAVFERLLQH